MITFDITPVLNRLAAWQKRKVKYQRRWFNEYKGGYFNDELYAKVVEAKKLIKN